MSEIDVLLSQVNVFLSKIDVMLSNCPEVHSSKSPVLPRIGNILSKMESIVAQHLFDTRPATDLSWDDGGHEVFYPEEDDLNYSLLFTSEGEDDEDHIKTNKEEEDKKSVNEEEADKKFTNEEEEDKKVVKKEEEDKKCATEEDDEGLSIAQRVKKRHNQNLRRFP